MDGAVSADNSGAFDPARRESPRYCLNRALRKKVQEVPVVPVRELKNLLKYVKVFYYGIDWDGDLWPLQPLRESPVNAKKRLTTGTTYRILVPAAALSVLPVYLAGGNH